MKNIGIIVIVLVLILGGWLMFGKGASTAPVGEYTQNLLGKWQNIEDASLQREFKTGGEVTDYYNNAAVMTGVYELFNSDNVPEGAPGTFDDPEAVYLRLSLTGEDADMLYFIVTDISGANLELTYLDRGGVLTFNKVQ